MNIVDSSGWLEYFADGPNASFFAPAIEKTAKLLIPTLSLYEVFRRVLQQREESWALQAIATMQQGRVIELTSSVALSAARISLQEKLPLADKHHAGHSQGLRRHPVDTGRGFQRNKRCALCGQKVTVYRSMRILSSVKRSKVNPYEQNIP